MKKDNRRFKTHTEFFEHCASMARPYEHEHNMALMLNSIAESLAAIADVMEEDDDDEDSDD